ncbi:MAG: porin [Gemmobacter sp.]
MKKVLLATTAVALSAGVAAAEVKLSGDARFGLMYNSDPTVGDFNFVSTGQTSKTRLEKRATINIDGSTVSDGGVTFGTRIRLRSEERSANAAGLGGRTIAAGARVFARAGGLEVGAGNINGAIEFMPGVYAPSVGLTGLSWGGLVTNVDRGGAFTANQFDWDAFSSGGGGAEGIEAIYTMGDFRAHVSYSSARLNGAVGNAKRLAAVGSYNWQGWTVALGIQDSNLDPEDKIVLTVGGKIGDFGVGFGAARNGKGVSRVNKYAVNASYTMGATTVSGYISNQNVLPVVGGSKSQYGIGASYNLGGGARIVGGIERTTRKTTRADLGVTFNF